MGFAKYLWSTFKKKKKFLQVVDLVTLIVLIASISWRQLSYFPNKMKPQLRLLSFSFHFDPWFNNDVIDKNLEATGQKLIYFLLFKVCKVFLQSITQSIKTYWVLHYVWLRLHPRRTLNLEQNQYFIFHLSNYFPWILRDIVII